MWSARGAIVGARSLAVAVQFGGLGGLLTACSSGSTGAPAKGGCTHEIAPSADDQTALQTLFIEAEAGSSICLAEGTYRFKTELSIAKNGIHLRGAGAGKTIFDFSQQDLGGNGMQLTGDDITLEGI